MSRTLRARKQLRLSLLLGLGCLLCLLMITSKLRSRWDLTAEAEFSLSPATIGLLEQLDDRLQLKLYFNRELEGAEQLLPLRIVLEDFLAELKAVAGELMSIETVDPTRDLATASQAQRVGISGLQIPLQGVSSSRVVTVWQGLEMRYQNRSEVIPFLVPAELEFAFASRLGNLLRPTRPRIGFFSREPALPPKVPGMELPIPEGRIFEELRQLLGQRYYVDDVSPADGAAMGLISTLVVARPDQVTAEELAGIKTYLATGGHVLILVDHQETNLQNLERREIDSGIDDWLQSLGVVVGRELVWEDEAFSLQLPPQLVELPDGRRMSVPQSASYGLWPVIPDRVLRNAHPVVAALSNLHFLWAHPLRLYQVPAQFEATTMFTTTAAGRLLDADSDIAPHLENIERLRAAAFKHGPAGEIPLVVSLSGDFSADPLLQPAGENQSKPGQLVVIGDSDLFTNTGISFMPTSGNRDFAANLFDWLCQDTALIGLRTRGGAERRLRSFLQESVEQQGGISASLQREEIESIEATARAHQRNMRRLIGWGNVVAPLVLLGLMALLHFAWHSRRSRRSPFSASGGGE